MLDVSDGETSWLEVPSPGTTGDNVLPKDETNEPF